MTTARTVPGPAQTRPARSGRPVLVAADLADLSGPVEGVVELPLRLFWSAPDRTFRIDDLDTLRSMYETVLTNAVRPDELATYLNRRRLIDVWPSLELSREVRQAWENRHPDLSRVAAAA